MKFGPGFIGGVWANKSLFCIGVFDGRSSACDWVVACSDLVRSGEPTRGDKMNLETDEAAPCRHAGTPAEWMVERVIKLFEQDIAHNPDLLRRSGLSTEEYQAAYPVAVERIRGRISASDEPKRTFVDQILEAGIAKGQFRSARLEPSELTKVYRVELTTGETVGIIRKGCPDGNHTTRWDRPSWANELYLWWLCPQSRVHEPGTSVWKGITRIRKKIASEPRNQLDGVIFFDPLCGTPERPCPKSAFGLSLDGARYPPPCIYVMPQLSGAPNGRLNWRGERRVAFTSALLAIFGVPEAQHASYLGFVGYEGDGQGIKTIRITNNYGGGRTTGCTG